MAKNTILAAETRDRAGKGAARAARRAGRVPAVIYGNNQDSVLITVEPVELFQKIRMGTFFSNICELTVGNETHKVLPRDVQFHPVSDAPIHVDFMRFSKNTRLTIEVPVAFRNEEECIGLKRGGVLNIVRHTVEMICSPDNIPDEITVDLSSFDIGDSVHISAFETPADAQFTITDRDFTVVTIAAPSLLVETSDEDEAEDGEGEGEGEEATATEGAESEE